MSSDPLDEIQWKSPEWIQAFGLHTANVLDYFSESPFYDRTSNNQVLRMQFQFQQIPPGIHPQRYLQDKLREMVGIEFVVAYVREPDFWVIRKQKRLDATHTITEQDYYIIGANVYQSPKIYDILSARLLATTLSMKKTLKLLNDMATFSLSEGGHVYSNNGEEENGGKLPNAATAGATNTPLSNSSPATAAAATANGDIGIMSNVTNVSSETSAAAFDSLLSGVVATNTEKSRNYLDDIPLYGKGSTVEALGLRVNLEED